MLAGGTFYYYCVVYATGGATSILSNVATVNVQGSIGLLTIDMVFVEGGTFMMGCTNEQGGNCYFNELPAHQVTLGNFSIGKYEITQAQWEAVMGSNPSNFKGNNLPVEMVSWNDIVGTSGISMTTNGITYYADGFIYKLNQITGKNYRLPTEAEWEFAARGGIQSQGYIYSGSNNVNDVAWWYSGFNPPNSTKPVGTKAPNELGIYDMSGNVLELCSDWFDLYTDTAKTNPIGPASGNERVFRGGSWNINMGLVRVSYRGNPTPYTRGNNIGFRVVLP